MRFQYDTSADALYIYLREREHVARTVEIDGSTNVDLDEDGGLLGIEVLAPGTLWPLEQVLYRHPLDLGDVRALMAAYPNAYSVSVEKTAATEMLERG